VGVLNGITYHERPGSNRLSYSPEGIVGIRIFHVEWGDRIDFAKILLGYVNAVGHLPVRTDAQTFPGYDYLYCQNATVEGEGELAEVGGEASYEVAKITAEYRPWKRGTTNAESDDYDEELETAMGSFEQSMEFSAEILSVAGSQWEYNVGPRIGEAVDTPVGIVVGNVDITLTSNAESEVPWTAIRNCLGCVNSVAWFGAPASYVLFLGASVRRTITSEGIGAWEICYRFREREASWNEVLVGSTWTWIRDATTHANPYESADFSTLFNV